MIGASWPVRYAEMSKESNSVALVGIEAGQASIPILVFREE